MAVIQISATLFKCATTDVDWSDAEYIGNVMQVVNETTHVVDHYEQYDGTNWNTL